MALTPCNCDPSMLSQTTIDSALILEEKLRLSPEIQNKMYQAEKSSDIDWICIVSNLQKNIAEKFCPNCELCRDKLLHKIRTAESTIVPHWRKYNRASRGHFGLGSEIIDCILINANNHQPLMLSDYVSTVKPTVLIAGSIS